MSVTAIQVQGRWRVVLHETPTGYLVPAEGDGAIECVAVENVEATREETVEDDDSCL